MMKKIINKLAIGLVGVILLFNLIGCKKDFLDTVNPRTLSPAVFPKSLTTLNSVLTSVYAVQHNYNIFGALWFPHTIYALDHTGDLIYRDSPEWNGINLGRALVNGDETGKSFLDFSQGITFANNCLNAAKAYRAIAPESEQQQIDWIEGQALFLRGFYMWHLQVMYGQPNLDGMGIPLRLTVPTTLDEMPIPRATTLQSYQQMISDFKKAATLLQGQPDKHRVTEWSAKAALARTYLFAEKNDSAKIYLLDCINNSGKSLVSFSAYNQMFNGDPAFENSSESFYEIENAQSLTYPNLWGGSNTGSQAEMFWSLFWVNADSVRSTSGFSNQFMHDRNLTRFGYNDPPLQTAIEKVGTKYKMTDAYLAQQKARRALAGRQADGPDPRVWVAGLQPMFDTILMDGVYRKIAQYDFPNEQWYKFSDSFVDKTKFYGWNLKKFSVLKGRLWDGGNWWLTGANFPFIRLPEIYLMYAEVLKNSDPATALEYINKVHRRAYNYDPNTPSPADYTSLAARTKTSADDHLANNPLLYEYWAEFFGEGRWWEVIRRFRLGQQEANFYQTAVAGRAIVWRDENYAMPIPTDELNRNSKMVQNPGY